MNLSQIERRIERLEAARAALPALPQVDHARAKIDLKGVFRSAYEAGPWILEGILRDTMHLSEDDIAWQMAKTAREYEAWLAAGEKEASAD
jgi:hypothetical protein